MTASATTTQASHIPRDLDECFAQLDQMLSSENRVRIQSGEVTPTDMHHGFGMYLRNEWGLWAESRLARYFHGMGIWHPDDMSAIILESYARYLRHEPLQVDEQVKYYQEYWANLREQDAVRSAPTTNTTAPSTTNTSR